MESEDENSNIYCGCNLPVLSLLERRRRLPLLNSNGAGTGSSDGGDYGNPFYRKLPQQHQLNLSVVKLDGSLFDVSVRRNATVADLKVAIKEFFAALPIEIHGTISWSHVWEHFCLSYEGQKLINNKACLRNFGIKDGDQLQFIQHMSIDHLPAKRSSKHHDVTCTQRNRSLPSLLPRSSNHQERQDSATDDDSNDANQEDNSSFNHYEDEKDDISHSKFKSAHLLRGWFSSTRS